MRPTSGLRDAEVESSLLDSNKCVPCPPLRYVKCALYRSTQYPLNYTQVNKLTRDEIESDLAFAGFLVFHCPLKSDAVESLKMLIDSSHRVG